MAPEDPNAAPTAPRRAPPRAPEAIERDIEVERAALAEAVSSLRERIDDTRAKVFSKKSLGILGGAATALVALRLRRRRRRHED
jgi:hypothetical protein